MAKTEKIIIGIDFNIENQKLRTLKKQLDTITKMKPTDIMAATGQDLNKSVKALNQVKTKAKEVQAALKAAYNPKLNTTNIEVFKRELGLTGKSLRELKQVFAQIGPQGDIAFAKLENQILKTGNAAKLTHATLNKIAITLSNSIKWVASSSLINNFTGSIQQAWGFTKSLDASLNDIRIVTGKNADEMARFAEKANTAAKSLGRTTTDYTKASLIFAQQGLKDEEVQARAEVTLKAANVTGQSAQSVSQELTAVWNGYNVSAEEAQVYVDRLAAVAASTASNLQELSTGMSKVAAAAASLGVGEDQLAAQLSTIISVTRQAPQTVGTALKTIYARITDIKAGVEEDGTTLGQYSGKLAEMGINVLDTAGNLKNMGTVIEEVGGKWQTFSKEQQIYIAQTMAGQRQYSNLISLFDNFDKYNDAMQVAGKAAGTLQSQQSTYMDSLEAHINQLTASTEDMWKSMVDSKSMKTLIDFLSGLTKTLTGIIDTLGGGGNVLLILGSIATTVLQKNITQGLQKTIFNFNQSREAAKNFKEKLEEIKNALASEQVKNDPQWQTYYERQKFIYESRKKYGSSLTEEQDKQLQKLQELNAEYRNNLQLRKAAQKALEKGDKVLERVQVSPQDTKDQNLKSRTDIYLASDGQEITYATQVNEILEQQKTAYKQARQELNLLQKTALDPTNMQAQFGAYLDQRIKDLNEKITELDGKKNISTEDIVQFVQLQEQLKKLTAQREAYNNAANKTSFVQQSQVANAKKDLFSLSASFKKLEQTAQQTSIAIKGNKIKDLFSDEQITSFNSLIKKIQDIKKEITKAINGEENSQDIETLQTELDKAKATLSAILTKGAAGVDAIQKNLAGVSDAAKYIDDIDEKAKNIDKTVKGIESKSSFEAISSQASQLLTSITRLATASSQLSNIGRTLGNHSIDAGKKVLGTFSSLSMVMLNYGKEFKKTIPATIEWMKNLAGANRKAALSATGLMTALGGIALIASVVTGVVSLIASWNEENKKAEEERLKATIESNNKILQEIKNNKKLYESLEQLNKKFEQGTTSRKELQSQVLQLCKQYNIESSIIQTLVTNYDNLGAAIAKVRQQALNEQIKTLKSNLVLGVDQLLTTQANEKSGNSYLYGDYVGNFSQKQIDILGQHGFKVIGSEIRRQVDINNKYAIAKANADLQSAIEDLASNQLTNGTGYKNLLEKYNYAKDKGLKTSVSNYQDLIKAEIQNAAFEENFENINSVEEYSKAKSQIYENFVNNNKDLALSMSPKEIEEYINQQLIQNHGEQFIKFANAADIYQKYDEVVGKHANELTKYTHVSLQDLAYLNPEDVSNWEKLQKILQYIEEKNTPIASALKINEATEAYQKYTDVLSKVTKGQKISAKEFNELDQNLQKYFIKSANGQYAFNGKLNELKQEMQQQQIELYGKNRQNILKDQEKSTRKFQSGYKSYLTGRTKEKDKLDILALKNAGQEFITDEDILSGNAAVRKKSATAFKTIWSNFKDRYSAFLTDTEDVAKLDKISQHDYFSAEDAKEYKVSIDKLRKELLQKGLVTAGDYDANQLNQMADILEKANGLKLSDEQREKIKDNNNIDSKIAEDIIEAYQKLQGKDFNIDEYTTHINENNENLKETDKLLHDSLFATDTDLKELDIYKLNNVIKETLTNSKQLSSFLKFDTQAIEDLAQKVLRFDNGVQDVAKNIGSWKAALQNDSLLSTQEIKDAYADILGVQEDVLSTSFLMSKNNLQLLKRAIVEQDNDAFLQLRENLEKSFNLQDIEDNVAKQIEQIKLQASDASKKIGDQITVESVDQILQTLYEQGLSIEQVAALFEGWGVNIHIIPKFEGNQKDGQVIGFTQQTGTQITKAANFDYLTKMLTNEALSAISNAKKRILNQVKLTKLLDKEIDLYHDINIELNLIDKKLAKLQKIQKNLSGIELLNNLQKQTKVLEEQNQKLKEKQRIQRQDLINQSSILKGLGATFNADGSLSNYSSLYGSAISSVNEIIGQIRTIEESTLGMDTSSAAYTQKKNQIDELKTEQDKRQEHLDRIEKYISKYDSTRSSLFDLVDKIEDSARSAIELNLQIFQTKVKIKLDLTQAQKDWDHFVSETLNRDDIFNPSAFKSRQKTVELAFKDIKYFDENYKNLSEQLARYQEETRRFQQARMSGIEYQSELFNSESEALAAAEQTSKQMQQAITSYADSMDAIKQAILDAYEDVSEIFSKNNDIYSFIKNQLNHDIQLIDLLEGGRGGRLKDSLYVQTNQFNMDNIKQLKAQVDYWANENAKATDEATRKLTKQKWKQTIESLNSATEEGIQNLKSKYENLIDTISKEMQDKLTGGFGFDYFTTEWDRVKERANSYLDPINAAFAIKDTQFNYRKVINDTSSLLNQQKLTKVMNEQLNILKQKDKLTQYDVDRANKILEIEKARIALEDARNNKTTLRLKRDSQGNYSYQFTADQTAIEEAQNKLDKAKNDLYNLDLKAYQGNADKVVKLTQDTQKKISEIMKDQNLSEKQRKQALLELQRSYQAQLTFLTKQNTSIRNNLMQSTTDAMSDSFNKGKIDFENMIDGWNSGIQKWINDLAKNPDSAFEIMKMGIQEMIQASESFKDKSSEYLEAAGDGYKTLKRIGIDPLVESENEAVTKVDDLITKINEITNTAQAWRSGLGTVASGFDAIKDSAKEAGDAILGYKRALAGNGQENNKGNGTGKTQYGNSVSASGTDLSSNFVDVSNLPPPQSNKVSWFDKINEAINMAKNKKSSALQKFLDIMTVLELNKEFAGFVTNFSIEGHGLEDSLNNILQNQQNDNQSYKLYAMINDKLDVFFQKNGWTEQEKKYRGMLLGNTSHYSYKAFQFVFGEGFPENLYNQWYKNFIDNRLKTKFDTGGYTGTWNSSQGKLAILHEKELILNKDDTQNMLKMLKITRDNQAQAFDYSSIFNTIANNLMTIVKEITLTKMQNDFNNIIESQSNMLKYKSQINKATQEIEQQVKIEANFPNVNSKEEIEAALSDLVNMAAQRALRINKNQ